MVLTQRSSQSTSSVKKQQSISTFFTKNTPSQKTISISPLSPTGDGKPSPSTNDENLERNENLFVASDDDDGPSPARRLPRKSKRDLEEEQITTNPPARKRARVSDVELVDREEGHRESVSSEIEDLEIKRPNSLAANERRIPNASRQTSKYAFSSSFAHDNENLIDDDETRKRKEVLHQKFVKKLGRPDSIADIKRRNWRETEDVVETQADSDDAEPDEEQNKAKASVKGKKGVATKKGGNKLTPMEKQLLDIKRDHMDTVLVIEVGYKFKFFGEDARIAAKELSIVCIPGKFRYDEHSSEAHLDRFASASFPVHRLHVHVKRLVAAGHKVGVVRQLETAALKAVGDNRNNPFTRKLTNLYTKGTYIDDVEGLERPSGEPSSNASATGYLLCITENNAKGWGTDEKVQIGMLAVQPATGDIIYDDFEDGFMRSEIETRLLHVAPCEILIVGDLSKATEKLVQHLSGSKTNIFGDRIRTERVERSKTMAVSAKSHVANFYASKMQATSLYHDGKASNLFDNVLELPENVTICLSAMITHMSNFGLEHVFDLTKYFQSFSARSHMLLNGTTLTSLEIYQNQTDHSETGSLFRTLDRTQTRFGRRLLRKWVGRPLLIKAELEERISAVEELKGSERTGRVDKIKHLLSQTKSDLEKSLIRIYYGKASVPSAFLTSLIACSVRGRNC